MVRAVPEIDARNIASQADFRALISQMDTPVILRGAPLVVPEQRPFVTSTLEADLGDLVLPERSTRDFFVGDQTGKEVMEADEVWLES